ncbi:MAG: BatA domain-containing protein [Chthoniobacteraceae bacterium]|jgi:hypothetical protein
MTFLQPYLLWLLPFAALPVIIHLLNRMRFRTVHWAATSFLFAANRASTRHARLRQILLLACRVLALAAMVLAVARPLAGGWAGWMLSSSPDVVLILMDHSASMEARDAQTGVTRRQQALEALARAAAAYGDHTRCVLFENVLRTPQEVAQPALLPQLPSVGPTDTAADMPALFDAAANWLVHNRTGLAEIWIASDLQQSNWQPASPHWRTISARIAALPETVRVRLLALDTRTAPNTSVTLVSATRQTHTSDPSLDLVFDIQRSETVPATLPVTFFLDGTRSHLDLDLDLDGPMTRVHHSLPLDPARESGYGSIQLPPDGNDRDNAAYFIYSPPPALRIAVIGPDDASRRCLAAAADPFPSDPNISRDALDQPDADIDWDKYALVIWDAPLPTGETAKKLEQFAAAGGALIFFPGAGADGNSFDTASWGDLKAGAFHVTHWDRQDGPVADSESGAPLALSAMQVAQARAISSGGDIRAVFGDNEPFLTERVAGTGRVYFCATLPRSDWSTLGDGRVLVPMLQRILQEGAKRFDAGSFLDAGDASLVDDPAGWTSLDPSGPRDVRSQAGVYRNGARLIAVNRPADEDDPGRITQAEARQLFAPLNAYSFAENGAGGEALQGEIWRALLFAMLIFLLGESFLSLPPARQPGLGHAERSQAKPFAIAGL